MADILFQDERKNTMSEATAAMPVDQLEVIFDEVLWNLLDKCQDNDLSAADVRTLWKAVKGFVYHENFDRFYLEKLNTDDEKFKTRYASAFNVQRYLIEADQVQGG
jgi:hypothetical protein